MTGDEETMVRIFAAARADMLQTSTASVLEYVKKALCLLWDPAKLEITNLPAANQFLRREYRKGWTLG